MNASANRKLKRIQAYSPCYNNNLIFQTTVLSSFSSRSEGEEGESDLINIVLK